LAEPVGGFGDLNAATGSGLLTIATTQSLQVGEVVAVRDEGTDTCKAVVVGLPCRGPHPRALDLVPVSRAELGEEVGG
jgi:hypothetical protein